MSATEDQSAGRATETDVQRGAGPGEASITVGGDCEFDHYGNIPDY